MPGEVLKPGEVLGRRALNRAFLARQLLLSRVPLRAADPGGQVIETVEHLAGLQAQAPFPPYYGLWSRLDGFRPAELAELLVNRQVVRIALMRSTIHLVSARDCLALRPLIQPVLDRTVSTIFGKHPLGMDTAALAAAGRQLVEEQPRTFSELGAQLASRWPGHEPADLARGVRALVPLVQVPPRAVWGRGGQARHTSAESWLGKPLRDDVSPAGLIRRYLAAFGPATVADIQSWSGLTGLRLVMGQLRPGLVTFRDENGRELFDLPDAPRPGPGAPAPVRLIAEFDNLLLSHRDRSRIISNGHQRRLYTRNGIFPGTVLVDGFVAGTWRLDRPAGAVTLAIELFEPVAKADREAIEREAHDMLTFAAPEAPSRTITIQGEGIVAKGG